MRCSSSWIINPGGTCVWWSWPADDAPSKELSCRGSECDHRELVRRCDDERRRIVVDPFVNDFNR